MNRDDFDELVERLSAGAAAQAVPVSGVMAKDEAGSTRRAAAEVTGAAIVACGRAAEQVRIDASFDESTGEHWRAQNERQSYEAHGPGGLTHLDSLGHFTWKGEYFGHGPMPDDLAVLSARGVFRRAVFIDLMAAAERGVLERGAPCPRKTLVDLLAATETPIEAGDVLVVRLNRHGDRVGALAIDCAAWIQEQGIAMIVSDGGSESAPSEVERLHVPWHVLCLVALGVHLVDSADLESLAETCTRLHRSSFALTLAPLVPGAATSAVVSPLALF